MARSIIILFLIIITSLAAFKLLNKNASAQDVQDAQDGSELSQILENQKLILEKLNVIEGKVDTLRTRIH